MPYSAAAHRPGIVKLLLTWRPGGCNKVEEYRASPRNAKLTKEWPTLVSRAPAIHQTDSSSMDLFAMGNDSDAPQKNSQTASFIHALDDPAIRWPLQ